MQTTRAELVTPELITPPTEAVDPHGQRLAEARSEFQAAWDAKLARREQRLSRLQRGIALSHTAALGIGLLAALCGWGLAALSMFPEAPPFLGKALTLGLIAAFVLIVLLRGAFLLWEHVENWRDERTSKHL